MAGRFDYTEQGGLTMTLTFAMGASKLTTEFICTCGYRAELTRPNHGGKLICPKCGEFLAEAKPELHRDFAQELEAEEAKERAKEGK
jgi:hypothetical protein